MRSPLLFAVCVVMSIEAVRENRFSAEVEASLLEFFHDAIPHDVIVAARQSKMLPFDMIAKTEEELAHILGISEVEAVSFQAQLSQVMELEALPGVDDINDEEITIDAGILARVEGKFVAEESDLVAEQTGQPAFMPVTMDDAMQEMYLLRGVGEQDYRYECVQGEHEDSERCGASESFGTLLPAEYNLPEGVRRFVGAIILGWGAHRNPPHELMPKLFTEPMFDAASRSWSAAPSQPCTLAEDTQVLVSFREAWDLRVEADRSAVRATSMEVLQAGGRMVLAGAMPYTDCHSLHRCPFCAKCLPTYAAAAFAHAWSLDVASGRSGCPAEEAAAIREGLLLLNFAWSVLNFEERLQPSALGVSLPAVIREHRRWMEAVAACESPSRSRTLAAKIPVKYPLQARIAGAHAELVPLLEHLEPSGHEFSLPVNFITLADLLADQQLARFRRRVLIDAGAGGPFNSGTKALLDLYEERSRFEEVILIEMDPSRLEVPAAYYESYNVSVWTALLRVGTRDKESDLLVMLDEGMGLTEDDLVVLKFDCDVGLTETSMEWGFLADLVLHNRYLALIDEIFVEMHYYHPSIWRDSFAWHTMWQHYDLLRQLRQNGVIVHQWP